MKNSSDIVSSDGFAGIKKYGRLFWNVVIFSENINFSKLGALRTKYGITEILMLMHCTALELERRLCKC